VRIDSDDTQIAIPENHQDLDHKNFLAEGRWCHRGLEFDLVWPVLEGSLVSRVPLLQEGVPESAVVDHMQRFVETKEFVVEVVMLADNSVNQGIGQKVEVQTLVGHKRRQLTVQVQVLKVLVVPWARQETVC